MLVIGNHTFNLLNLVMKETVVKQQTSQLGKQFYNQETSSASIASMNLQGDSLFPVGFSEHSLQCVVTTAVSDLSFFSLNLVYWLISQHRFFTYLYGKAQSNFPYILGISLKMARGSFICSMQKFRGTMKGYIQQTKHILKSLKLFNYQS